MAVSLIFQVNKTKMNKIFLLVIAFLLTSAAWGQYVPVTPDMYYKRGYIYLKNGSVLKGKYVYAPNMEKLRVASGKNTWIFNASEVDRISRTKPREIRISDTSYIQPVVPASRWFNLTEIGVLVGNTDNSQSAPLVFGTSMNRQIYNNLSAGAGIGVEFLKETYLPVTVNLLYKLHNTRFTPFGMIQAGYQIPVEDSRPLYRDIYPQYDYSSYLYNYYISPSTEMKARGGFLFNPSFGFIRQSDRGFGMSLAFGYRFHRLHFKGEEDYRLDIDYNRFSVKLGIILN